MGRKSLYALILRAPLCGANKACKSRMETLVELSPSLGCRVGWGQHALTPPDSSHCVPLGGQPPCQHHPNNYATHYLLCSRPSNPSVTSTYSLHPPYLTLLSTPLASASLAPCSYLLLAVANQLSPHSPPQTFTLLEQYMLQLCISPTRRAVE